jgi:teichuronic acid biosynthesis glycosyltransferase TuaC
MKVLVFTSLYPNNVWPNHGVFIKERMSQFAKLDGRTVKIVAPVPYFPNLKCNWRWTFSQVARREIRDGVEVYHPRYLMPPKVGMMFYGLLMLLAVLTTVKRIQKDFEFDLIDAHYVYPDGFAAVLLGVLFRKPVIVSARGSDISLYSTFPLIRKLLQYTLHKTNKIIAVCQALKDAIVSLGIPEEKIVVVPNGVDLAKFYRLPKDEARKRLGLPADKKIILSVGGLIPRKGFDLLIQALNMMMIESNMTNLHLIIVGEGPSREDLTKLARSLGRSDAVQFTGAIPHENLYLWYSAADCFCLASSREGWPNVILESLACGTPVVAADIWGVPEVITSGAVGLLTGRTEYAIAEGLRVALRKKWSFDDLVEYASNHSWIRSASGVRDVFENTLANNAVKKQRRTNRLSKLLCVTKLLASKFSICHRAK